jgi:hypothetical protein
MADEIGMCESIGITFNNMSEDFNEYVEGQTEKRQ